MKKILVAVMAAGLLGTFAQANEKREVVVSEFKHQATKIVPLSATKFEVTDKHGNTKVVNLKGKKFIVVSVKEPGSEGKSYAVDEDGTIWWQDVISSGAAGGHETTSGIFPVIVKRRFHMSATHPSTDGVNNMDFEIQFTQDGQALHLGHTNMMSHGCIHVGKKDIETMFNWVDMQTKIIVMRGHYGQFLNAELNQFNKDMKAYDKSHK
ncbi:MAG: L,D-transpeptidase [Campylobacterota bacterium]|nr:L,D-transpeptidase [Campylobacterota bacterium]